MWPGYMVLSGIELFNAGRTFAYIRHALPEWSFRDVWDSEDINLITGEPKYEAPLLDDAPWVNRNDPDTWNFYGLYPLMVAGGADGNRQADITELVGDGSIASRPRLGSKEILVKALMVAGDERAMAAGMRWLNSALAGGQCEPGACGAGTLCYFNAKPVLDSNSEFGGEHPEEPYKVLGNNDPYAEALIEGGWEFREETGDAVLYPEGYVTPSECAEPYHRTLYRVTCIDGAKVLADHTVSQGAMREVSFILSAGVAYAYTLPVPGGTAVTDVIFTPQIPCPKPVLTPLSDPLYPAIVTPPQAPSITQTGLPPTPLSWDRRVIPISETAVPQWNDGVVLLKLVTGPTALRNARIRFYANPFGYEFSELPECDYCGEFIVSYVPPNATMEIDGIMETVIVTMNNTNQEYTAGHLLFGTNDEPFSWPLLSCGIPYYMVVDVDPLYSTIWSDFNQVLEFSISGRA